MSEYTFADVIIDPEDPRIEIGAKYYRADYPKKVLFLANNDEYYIGTLEEIDTESPETPFVVRTGGAHAPWACIIRKKEPDKRYVPFDLSLPEDREKLRKAWVREKDSGRELAVTAIYLDEKPPFVELNDNGFTVEDLLESYEFLDGTPCGKLVEVTDGN